MAIDHDRNVADAAAEADAAERRARAAERDLADRFGIGSDRFLELSEDQRRHERRWNEADKEAQEAAGKLEEAQRAQRAHNAQRAAAAAAQAPSGGSSVAGVASGGGAIGVVLLWVGVMAVMFVIAVTWTLLVAARVYATFAAPLLIVAAVIAIRRARTGATPARYRVAALGYVAIVIAAVGVLGWAISDRFGEPSISGGGWQQGTSAVLALVGAAFIFGLRWPWLGRPLVAALAGPGTLIPLQSKAHLGTYGQLQYLVTPRTRPDGWLPARSGHATRVDLHGQQWQVRCAQCGPLGGLRPDPARAERVARRHTVTAKAPKPQLAPGGETYSQTLQRTAGQ